MSRKGQLRSELVAGKRGRCSRRRFPRRVRSGLTRRNEIAFRETSGGLEVRVEPPRGITLTQRLEIRIARLEQAAKAHTKYDPACICFP
jgi:hypothetical protein